MLSVNATRFLAFNSNSYWVYQISVEPQKKYLTIKNLKYIFSLTWYDKTFEKGSILPKFKEGENLSADALLRVTEGIDWIFRGLKFEPDADTKWHVVKH